jgi:DNA-binding CsgD family transcriptional regulator
MGQRQLPGVDEAALYLNWQLSGVANRITMLNAMASILDELVPSDTLIWNGLDLSAGECEVHGILPSREFGEGAGRLLLEVAGDDPMVDTYLSEQGPDTLSPRRMSDIVSRSALKRTRAYNDLLHPYGAEYQMTVLTARMIGSMGGRCWTFNRTDRDFTDAERDLADRIQPMLVALEQVWDHAAGTASQAPEMREIQQDVGLTPREIQVLQCTARGLTAAATARSLRIAEATVRKHLENCYRKLDRRDRLTAVDRARQLGVLSGVSTFTRVDRTMP